MRMGSDELPKSLFPIGDRPILWHIMSIYSHYGFRDFILCLGFKQDKIINYFKRIKRWKITFVDTGIDTNTGERIKRIKNYIDEECFFATYGDGLCDINLRQLLAFHKSHKKDVTITAVRPYSPFGIVAINKNKVTDFQEKPKLDHWINGGFFVFNKKILKSLRNNDVLEKDTFLRAVRNKNIMAYKHKGFWECMDTYKDNIRLNQLWNAKRAPWALWK